MITVTTTDGLKSDTQNLDIIPSYSIGDTGPAGGIIFYVKAAPSDGWQYLECPIADQGTSIRWGDQAVLYDSVDFYNELGRGDENTRKIIVYNSALDDDYAAKVCDELVLGGFGDWYLPNKAEIYQMYLQKDVIKGFTGIKYYSSSRHECNYAGCYIFSGENEGWSGEGADNQNYVRACRKF